MRVKGGTTTRARRKRILKRADGYMGRKGTNFKTAKQAVIKSDVYAYRDRKNRKREFRKLWIQRINGAVREQGISYSRFMNTLKNMNIELNRKMLSEMAINEPKAFDALVQKVIKKAEKEAAK